MSKLTLTERRNALLAAMAIIAAEMARLAEEEDGIYVYRHSYEIVTWDHLLGWHSSGWEDTERRMEVKQC